MSLSSNPILQSNPDQTNSLYKTTLSLSIDAAVRWWGDFLKKSLGLEILKKFENSLRENLIIKLKDHWYPELPFKGQGYRSVSLDKKGPCDPVLQKAAVSAGISESLVSFLKDVESILIWIDPDVVVVRLCYTGFLNMPPEEKALYRSPLSIKPSHYNPYAKPASHPSTPNRNSFVGRGNTPLPLRPSTPPFSTHSFRTNSPGLTSNATPFIPSLSYATSNPFSQKNTQSRNGFSFNNNSGALNWYNNGQLSETWNDYSAATALYQGGNYTTNKQQLYGEYSGPELPLETQA